MIHERLASPRLSVPLLSAAARSAFSLIAPAPPSNFPQSLFITEPSLDPIVCSRFHTSSSRGTGSQTAGGPCAAAARVVLDRPPLPPVAVAVAVAERRGALRTLVSLSLARLCPRACHCRATSTC